MKPFPWRPGMLDLNGHRILAVGPDGRPLVWAVERYGEPRIIHYQPFMGDLWERCQPDPNDGATKGALLDAVREAWGAPAAQVTPYVRWDPHAQRTVIDEWMVCLNDAEDRMFRGHSYEFAALLAAWEAAP